MLENAGEVAPEWRGVEIGKKVGSDLRKCNNRQ